MAATEVYTLHWKLFHEGLTGAFRDLRQDSDFNDVLLTFDDETFMETNKTILSACSPFLKKIIKRTSQNKKFNSAIYLSGFKSKLVMLLVDFMYNGEIKVMADDVESFLSAANRLKVRGLATDIEEEETQTIESRTNHDVSNDVNDVIDVEETLPEQPLADNLMIGDDVREKPTAAEDLTASFDGSSYKCADCDKLFPREKSLKTHRELFHDVGIIWSCKVCDKKFKIKNSLNAHTYRIHRSEKGSDATPSNDGETVVKKEKKEASIGEFQCASCKKTFPSEKRLASHDDYYHPHEGVVFNCGIGDCEKTFHTKNSRNAHQYSSHTSEQRQMLKESRARAETSQALIDDVKEEEGYQKEDNTSDDLMSEMDAKVEEYLKMDDISGDVPSVMEEVTLE